MGADKPKLKSGFMTTEFWTSLFAQVAGLAVLSGYVSPDTSTELAGAAGQIAGAVLAAAGALGYAGSRGKAKSTETTVSE